METAEVEEPILDTEEEYRAIEVAMLGTARGRWFLAEHSRRSRRMETGQLEVALSQLKSSLRSPPALLGRLQTELDQIKDLIAETRTELLARETGSGAEGADRPAAARLLQAAEALHESIWTLQTRDVDASLCEEIGRQTASIFALTARQAQESRRVAKMSEALDQITERVSAALETVLHELRPAEEADADAA